MTDKTKLLKMVENALQTAPPDGVLFNEKKWSGSHDKYCCKGEKYRYNMSENAR